MVPEQGLDMYTKCSIHRAMSSYLGGLLTTGVILRSNLSSLNEQTFLARPGRHDR